MASQVPLLAGIAIPLGAILLAASVIYLVRLVERSRLFDVDLVDRQEIRFSESGSVVLHIRGPARNRRRPRLSFEIRDPSIGAMVESKATLPSRIGSSKGARFAMRRFEITHPGPYLLLAGGLEKLGDLSRWKVVFARPMEGRLLASILSIVLGSLAFLFGILSVFLPGGAM